MFIKICGTTSEDDALLSVALGADMLGFVFAPSPRQISAQLASDIVKRLPPEITSIGVFRDEAPERVVKTVQRAGLRGAQLHGKETAEDSKWVRERVPLVIKAFAAGDAEVAKAASYGVDAIMLDAPNPGSGEVFDWAFAAEVPVGNQVMIAGGLTPDNVATAVERTKPWGVDVSTGVEASPGKKDPVRLREFIVAARSAAPSTYRPKDEEAPFDWQDDS